MQISYMLLLFCLKHLAPHWVFERLSRSLEYFRKPYSHEKVKPKKLMLVTLLDIAWQKNNVEPSRQQLFKVIKSYLGQSMDHSEQPVSLSQRSGEISVGSVLVKVDSSSSTQDSSTSKEVVVSWTHSDELLGSKLLNLTQNYCMGQNRWHQKTRQVKATDLESTLEPNDGCFHLLLKSSWI